jgi:tRNA modification GTPase
VGQAPPAEWRPEPRRLLVRTFADQDPCAADPKADCFVSSVGPPGVDGLLRSFERVAAFSFRRGGRRIAERCHASLESAALALDETLRLSRDGAGMEYVAVALRETLAALGEIVGVVYTDDLLDRVFSRFCIGK